MSRFRKGWTRLAFVVSIAWITVVTGYVAYESRLSSGERRVFFDSEDKNSNKWLDAFIAGKPEPTPIYITHFQTSRFVDIALLPLLAVWFGVIVIVPVVSWVHGGFKG